MNIVASASSLGRAEILGEAEYPFSETDRLTVLLDVAEKFCQRFGLGEDIILETYTETSDWAFFVKVDALHETACRDLMARLLTMRPSVGRLGAEMSAFVDDIDFQGRGSILRLIELTRRPIRHVCFFKCVRRVRDAFAHDFRSVNATLMELIEPLADKAQLLKAFSGMAEEAYDEAKYTRCVRNDPGFLRFGILRQSLEFLGQLHADFPEAGKDAAVSLAGAEDARAAKPHRALSMSGKPRPDSLGGLVSPGAADKSASDESAAALDPDHPAKAAAYIRSLFTNPKRPNQTRSLWRYFLAFSAKGLVAIGGFAASAVIYSFYGIWPAIATAAAGLIPIARDGWTQGAWKGHCPHCDAEITVAAGKAVTRGLSCPACAGRLRLHAGSFIAI